MASRRYSAANMRTLSERIFSALGYSEKDSRDITDVMIQADLFGIESHGLQRLALYDYGLKIGRIKLTPNIQVLKETPVSALIDADDAMGQVVSIMAMEKAVEKAKKSGISIVEVRGSNHFGIAGYYSYHMAQQGLMGLAMTNSEALAVPTFGKRALLGSNPISLAMPATPHPFLLDMATCVVPRGKLEVQIKKEQPIPVGWAINADGKVSDDPGEVNACFVNKTCGGILPLGGDKEMFGSHKGYGMGMLVELFTSILSGGFTSNLIRKVHAVDRCCHSFIAIDYSMFGDPGEIEAHLSEYMQVLRESEKSDGSTRIYTHGEKEMESMTMREKNGLELVDKTVAEIRTIAERLNIPCEQYLKANE